MDYIKRYNVLVIFVVLVCIFTMFFYPILISKSAFDGAKMWSVSIFPTLFPFFVCTNMLIHLGFAKFMGEMLSPFMIPFFGVSGIGSFPLFSGMMSGYPVGAKITTNLYEDDKLNKKEAQRLLAFSNNCGPLFIIGVIGGYIFKSVVVGYYILFLHILSALLYGIFLNVFMGSVNTKVVSRKNHIREAFKQMRIHTSNNNKTFGQILSESVEGAIKSSLVVLGFVVLFNVISTIIELFHIHMIITDMFNFITHLNIDGKIIESIFLGAIEMTAGLFLIDGKVNQLNIMVALFIVTFGGFSVHAQSISFIAKTDLSETRYIFDKFLKGLLSVVLTFITYPFFKMILKHIDTHVTPVFLNNSFSLNMFFELRDAYSIFVVISFVFILIVCVMFNQKKER